MRGSIHCRFFGLGLASAMIFPITSSIAHGALTNISVSVDGTGGRSGNGPFTHVSAVAQSGGVSVSGSGAFINYAGFLNPRTLGELQTTTTTTSTTTTSTSSTTTTTTTTSTTTTTTSTSSTSTTSTTIAAPVIITVIDRTKLLAIYLPGGTVAPYYATNLSTMPVEWTPVQTFTDNEIVTDVHLIEMLTPGSPSMMYYMLLQTFE